MSQAKGPPRTNPPEADGTGQAPDLRTVLVECSVPSVSSDRATPDPIPNSAVKPVSADDTPSGGK